MLGVGAGEMPDLPARLELTTRVSYEIDGARAGAGLEGCPTCARLTDYAGSPTKLIARVKGCSG